MCKPPFSSTSRGWTQPPDAFEAVAAKGEHA